MRPTLLLDCDGVLADFLTAALEVVHELTGERHDPETIRTWEVFDSIGTPELRQRTYEIMNRPGFGDTRIHPYPGAIEGVTALRKHVDIYIVTAPFFDAAWMNDRYTWLKRHFGINSGNVVFASRKHLVRGDLFVDDNPDHIRDWNQSRYPGVGVLWDRPYNRQHDLPRVHGWDELLAKAAGL